jgi:hypothetical protein
MGILDDAIRQHLDLKRRQGAEEDELQRLEDEAFGPPSRPGDPDFPATGEEDESGNGRPPSGESVATEEPPGAEPEPAAAQAPAEQPLAPETAEERLPDTQTPEPSGGAFYDQREDEPPTADELARADGGTDEPPIESLDTVEHPFAGEIEDSGEAEAVEQPSTAEEQLTDEEEVVEGELAEEGEGEDVLEETPEFLRDQPEDDELWFEQGEPKDFDF